MKKNFVFHHKLLNQNFSATRQGIFFSLSMYLNDPEDLSTVI